MGNLDTAELVNLYQTGFFLSMALTIISAILAAYVFVKKDIKTLFIKKTGIGRMQTARQMQMKNERTDQLNSAGVNLEFGKTDETVSTEELRNDTQQKGKTKEVTGSTIIQGLFKGKSKTGEIGRKSEKLEPERVVRNETSVFQAESGFTISERIIVTHTNELIDV